MTDLHNILAEMRAKTDAATPGPWTGTTVDSISGGTIYDRTLAIANVEYDVEPVDPRIRRFRTEDEADANAAFIAMARTAMPALLSAVEKVLALRDEAEPVGIEAGVARGMVGIREVRKAIQEALGGVNHD